MAVTLIFYFLFVSFAVGLSVLLFSFLYKFLCWVGEIVVSLSTR